jgi:hypothetical protein
MIPYTIQGVILSVSILSLYGKSGTILGERMVMLIGAYCIIILPHIYQGIRNSMHAVNMPMLLEAAEMLAEEGISATVLNMPTIKPIDEDAIVAAANATGAIVTCEEHNIIGGLGSAVAEVLAEKASARLVRVGVKDTFGESGKPADLLKKYGLTAADIVAAAKQAIANK